MMKVKLTLFDLYNLDFSSAIDLTCGMQTKYNGKGVFLFFCLATWQNFGHMSLENQILKSSTNTGYEYS